MCRPGFRHKTDERFGARRRGNLHQQPFVVFEIHGSELKLPPVHYLCGASGLRIMRDAFFPGAGKDLFSGLFPLLV